MPTPLVFGNYKKEYNFFWQLSPLLSRNEYLLKATKSMPTEVAMFKTLMNVVSTTYISQLAETFNPPEDEIEMDMVDVGVVTYPVPKKYKMSDISIVYLEDSANTVYNFHKTWMSLIRSGDSMCMNPLMPFSVKAIYADLDNTITGTEYSLISKILDGVNNSLKSNFNDSNAVGNTASSMFKSIDIGQKITSITTYPHIVPTRISRSTMNKQGNTISKVTVTYARLPEVRNNVGVQILSSGVWV